MAPEHDIRIDGTLKPRSKFLGNSVGSFMEGIAVMRIKNERYFITQPNMYARGILFGKMKYELGDHAYVRCPELGLEAEIDFKVKGWMTGTYNAIGGHIRDTKSGKNLFELSGYWDKEMHIKNLTTGKKELVFDASHARPSYPKARPLDEQAERESQKLWNKVTQAIKVADQRTATDEKSFIEDRQRAEAAERGEHGEWLPKLFRRTRPGASQGPGDMDGEENLDWVIDATMLVLLLLLFPLYLLTHQIPSDGKTPDEIVQQILAIAPILPGQKAAASQPQSKAEGSPTATQSSSSPSLPPQEPQQQQPQTSHSINTHETSNLVHVAPRQAPTSAPQQHKQEEQQPQQQQQQKSGLDSIGDLKGPLQPIIHRQDSVEGVDEVFHDADS
jgi:hypothetical protein